MIARPAPGFVKSYLKDFFSWMPGVIGRFLLFFISVPLFTVLFQLIGPYEHVSKEDFTHSVFKVIKLTGNDLSVTRYIQTEFNYSRGYDAYVLALQSGGGKINSDSANSHYSVQQLPGGGVRVELSTNGGESYVYDVIGPHIYPVKKKVAARWIPLSLLCSGFSVWLVPLLAQRVKRKRKSMNK